MIVLVGEAAIDNFNRGDFDYAMAQCWVESGGLRIKNNLSHACALRLCAIDSMTPRFASSSAFSFPGFPSCPLTHTHSILWLSTNASSRCHRSTFFTGFLSTVRQPRFFQSWIQTEIPLCTYLESVCNRTVQLRFRLLSAWITAINSIRLFVVSASPPQNSFS